MKKILVVALCIVLVMLSVTSCAKPPELFEIEERLVELIEASYEVNDILFGDGLDVYEKVYEPELLVYRPNGTNKVYYYYIIDDDELGRIYAYRDTEILYFTASDIEKDGEESVFQDENGKYYYEITYNGSDMEKEVSSYLDKKSGKTYYFYVIEDKTLGKVYEYRLQTVTYINRVEEKKEEAEAVFEDGEYFYYPVAYEEEKYDFYYTDKSPVGYSYVRLDEKYNTIEQIQALAESVYSTQYLEGIYESLFAGVMISEEASGRLGARYYNHTDENGNVWLMESDEYDSLIKGKRIYDMSTARVVKPGNPTFANVEIDTYLEGSPDKRDTVRLSLIKQEDGKWYLDNATY